MNKKLSMVSIACLLAVTLIQTVPYHTLEKQDQPSENWGTWTQLKKLSF